MYVEPKEECMVLFVLIFKNNLRKQCFKMYFSDNLGGIQEPNGAGIHVLSEDYKIHPT